MSIGLVVPVRYDVRQHHSQEAVVNFLGVLPPQPASVLQNTTPRNIHTELSLSKLPPRYAVQVSSAGSAFGFGAGLD